MPLYLLETKDGRIKQVVRAVCTACARRLAVEQSKEEGTLIWRDAEQSTVKLIEPDKGITGVVLRQEVKP